MGHESGRSAWIWRVIRRHGFSSFVPFARRVLDTLAYAAAARASSRGFVCAFLTRISSDGPWSFGVALEGSTSRQRSRTRKILSLPERGPMPWTSLSARGFPQIVILRGATQISIVPRSKVPASVPIQSLSPTVVRPQFNGRTNSLSAWPQSCNSCQDPEPRLSKIA